MLYGRTRTIHLVRRAIQRSQESLQSLATRYSTNLKTGQVRQTPQRTRSTYGPRTDFEGAQRQIRSYCGGLPAVPLLALDDRRCAMRAIISTYRAQRNATALAACR
jgi:hypothetical protein